MVERGSRVLVIIIMVLTSVLLTFPALAPDVEGATYRSDPITVEGDDGFHDAGFTGSGTAGDPYVLSDLNLNASLEPHPPHNL